MMNQDNFIKNKLKKIDLKKIKSEKKLLKKNILQ
jgi:hypothetical protein